MKQCRAFLAADPVVLAAGAAAPKALAGQQELLPEE